MRTDRNTRTRRGLRAAGAGLLVSGLMTVFAPASPAAAAPAAGGFADAAGVILDVVVLTALPLPGPIAGTPIDPNTFAKATQTCPPQVKDPASDVLLGVGVAPVVDTQTVSAMAGANCAAAGGPVAVASAQTEALKLLSLTGAPLITADVIRAQANTDCIKAPNGDGSLFVNLKINGQAIGNTPPPNTTIDIPNVATVIVNEQHPTADGRGIVVNGLHVIGKSPLLRGDIIVSHAVSGVVCPNGKGAENGPLPKPEIAFDKDASPSTARPGDTVTYTTTVTNTSQNNCDVLRYIDHLAPVFDFVSTSGALGTTATKVTRGDGGIDVVIKPAAPAGTGSIQLAPGKSFTQSFVVKVKDNAPPGTYYDTLEIFCNDGGDFASGPLAPVTIPGAGPVKPPVVNPPDIEEPIVPTLPRTGGEPLLALGALGVLGAAVATRRFATR